MCSVLEGHLVTFKIRYAIAHLSHTTSIVMKHILFFFILIFSTFSLAVHAQEIHKCGTTAEDGMHIKQRMLENRATVNQVRSRNAVSYVPIRFIIMGTDSGSGYISETKCLEAICLLNEFYEDLDIIFYLKEFEYLNNSTVYNNAKCSTCDNFFSDYMDGRYNAMNMFIVNNAGAGAGGGITLGFYAPSVPGLPRDYIVIRKANLLDVDVTAHEVGHFFSLSHPFLGWEGAPYNDINPQPAPATAPSGQNPTERANGSNCTTAGDGICDTPADYLNAFSPSHSGNCEPYDGGALDPLGTPIDPQEENIMSYFRNCSEYVLTPQQIEAVLDDISSTKRFYLKIGNPAPTNGPIAGTPELTFPADGTQLDTYDGITLTWTAVSEATEYIVEIDNSSIFASPNFQRYFVSGTSLTVNLIEDAPYYWRVLAYNPVYTCEPFSETSFFRTGLLSATNEIAELERVSVSPNPVQYGEPILVTLSTLTSFDAKLEVVDMTGRVVFHEQLKIAGGQTALSIETGALQTGMYFIRLESASGVNSTKVIIQ